MSLIKHAEFELRKAGLFEANSDYDGKLGLAVLEIVKVFAAQGFSGYSAQMAAAYINKLVKFQVLSPITNNPEEWQEIDKDTWQSKRQPSLFSADAGLTYYDVDDKSRKTRRSEPELKTV